MRIVAGRLKGRALQAPDGKETRPTSDRAREALFNILAHGAPGLAGARFLDVFAGSGAVGLEALSRGAVHAYFIENERAAVRCLEANIQRLDLAAQSTLFRIDVRLTPAAPEPCDFVFMDPPYHSGLGSEALIVLTQRGWVGHNCRVVLELAAKERFAAPSHEWSILDERRYGAARLVFLQTCNAGDSDGPA